MYAPVAARRLGVAMAAGLALAPAALAGPPAPSGTLATVEVLTGGDYTLRMFRDASGEITLLSERPVDAEGATRISGTRLIATSSDSLDRADPVFVGIDEFPSRELLSHEIYLLFGLTLQDVETALSRGTPAAEPAEVAQSRADARRATTRVVSRHFGPDAGALAAAAGGRPVLSVGPTAFGLPRTRATLVDGRSAHTGRIGPYAAVVYGTGTVYASALCDRCVVVTTARLGSPAARRQLQGRRMARDPRLGRGRALRLDDVSVVALRGRALVTVSRHPRLTDAAARTLLRALRVE
jgi:hypothetical protein